MTEHPPAGQQPDPRQYPQQPYPYPGPGGPQPQQYGQPMYPPPGYPQQPYGPPYAQPMVSKTRITGTAHTIHLILTICTCGVWGIVWFLHWLLTRSKTVTKPY
ncbi:hypothetical protein [Microbispora sp. KK1-11]|uniref:hypothetical protein n=1 Tax=Microbispora sp. KK1-11 TaxID=2053005 RepID=UPI0011599CF8|nr:hypothetical protein [Microbispora sp. KK1-11]TQS30088.1 hypothetical protein FLW16_06920 [Microbispora sp. KK1-11]